MDLWKVLNVAGGAMEEDAEYQREAAYRVQGVQTIGAAHFPW
jgi:hypothetical protein